MPTQQLLVRLPEDLARRLKRRVPARGRSAFIQELLEQALPPRRGKRRSPVSGCPGGGTGRAACERNGGLGCRSRGRADARDHGAARVSRVPAAPASPVPVRRGEVWWVDLDPTRGGEIQKTRPAVVLTANALNPGAAHRGRSTLVHRPRAPAAGRDRHALGRSGKRCSVRPGARRGPEPPDPAHRAVDGGGPTRRRGRDTGGARVVTARLLATHPAYGFSGLHQAQSHHCRAGLTQQES